MKNICLPIIIIIVIVISIIAISKYQDTKGNFINGMWSNNDEDIFMYIDEKSNNGWKGGYLVSQKNNINEQFKIKTEIGISDTVKIKKKKSNFLNKKMISKLKLDDGIIEITSKNNKKYKLFKDTENTNKMKVNKK